MSLRADHVSATRQAILAAARDRFGTAGYAATSIDAVATDARVTKGAVYHHFGSKPGLFRAVYEEVERAAQRTPGRRVAADAPVVEHLLAGVDAYLDAVMDPVVQRITLVDAPAVLGLEPDGPAEADPGHIGLRAVLAAAVDAGELVDIDPDAVAHLVRGACLHAAMLISRSEDHPAARARFGGAVAALVRGLQR
jgi:AcrR family transcriptional regulator